MKQWLVNHMIRLILRVLIKLDADELKNFPDDGPLLVVANHINFLDAPVLISHLYPRPTTGFVKKETWDNPLLAFLFNVWDGVPIDRSTADFSALNMAKKALEDKKIFAVTPEGTRTEDGRLIRAKPGIGFLIYQCNAPILPIAFWGHENFLKNIKRLKRSDMYIRVGKQFHVEINGNRKDKETMQAIADAMMLEIAKLLPEQYHGVYAGGDYDVEKYIKFLD